MEKIIFSSDLHGAREDAARLITWFTLEKADRIVLLGDILYHGARNPLPPDYSPRETIAILEPYADRILCVRGNCDSDVDKMVLPFPVFDYAVIAIEDRFIHLTHGDKYGEDAPPPMKKGDILMSGHTHVAKLSVKEDYVYMNPGSVGIPKEKTPPSYILFDGKTFHLKSLLNGQAYDTFAL